jgi:hypothetical protein
MERRQYGASLTSEAVRRLQFGWLALGQVRKVDLDLFARVPEGALIVAFRNVLAHGYATLDHRRVFDAATHKVDELMRTLHVLLREFPEDPTDPTA